MQAIGATLAGLTAQILPTGTAMATLAVASLVVTTALSPGLRLSDPQIGCPLPHTGMSRWRNPVGHRLKHEARPCRLGAGEERVCQDPTNATCKRRSTASTKDPGVENVALAPS